MSYILDALKRAERERSATANEYAGAAPTPPSRSLRPTTVALAGASLFLAGIGVAALLLRAPSPASAPAPQAAATPAPEPTPVPAAAAPATAPPVLGDVSELTAYETLDDVSPVFQGSVIAPPAAAAKPLASPAATVINVPTRSVPADAVAARSPSAVGNNGAQAPARDLPPRLAEMPDSYQSRFPSPTIQVHVFDAEPSRRWIMVENRRQGEGGVLGNGLVIAEIVSDGVIFEFSGSRVYWPLNR